jgi:tetratricopeptide (TPR) repeat protein
MDWQAPVLKALDAFERRLGGNVQYRLGKRLLEQNRTADALEAFVQSEKLMAESKRPNPRHIVAAIIRQAYCHAKLGNGQQACKEYSRALREMNLLGDADHPTARAIASYLANAECEDTRSLGDST